MKLAFALLLAALAPSKRPLEFADLPASFAAQLQIAGAAQFERLRAEIDRETAGRVALGNQEALAYLILQSASFTRRARIEPALSAREFVEGSGAVPTGVRARIRDFLTALERAPADERLRWFARRRPSEEECVAAYAAAMRLLYSKEFGSEKQRPAEWYQSRGFSTDTQVEANFAVFTALDVIRALAPETHLQRILIVGPGLDFAPRTALRDQPPQSYQPFLILDGLLRRKMAEAARVSIHAVDIDPRVVHFIREFSRRDAPALMLPPVAANADYRQELRAMGTGIGALRGSVLHIRPALAAVVSAAPLNIITERYQPSPQYDLAIATNVLVYFGNQELALALANIHAMLRPGGWFIHNEPRAELEQYAQALGLPALQGRTIEIAQGAKAPLRDSVVIHRRTQ